MPIKDRPMPEPMESIVDWAREIMAESPDLIVASASDDISLIRDLPTDEKPLSKEADLQAS